MTTPFPLLHQLASKHVLESLFVFLLTAEPASYQTVSRPVLLQHPFSLQQHCGVGWPRCWSLEDFRYPTWSAGQCPETGPETVSNSIQADLL